MLDGFLQMYQHDGISFIFVGVTEPEEVFDRFKSQRETQKRLNYLQQTTEEEKLLLEETQTTLMAELEGYKFASVKDKDE